MTSPDEAVAMSFFLHGGAINMETPNPDAKRNYISNH